MNGKVRVYQTQSRLIGLHAACVLTVARITSSVTPRFDYAPKRPSARVMKGQPAFKGEDARLGTCELCDMRAMPDKEFMAFYRILALASRTIQLADDKALSQGQFEIMEFVRQERAIEITKGRDPDPEPAVEPGQLKQRPSRPHKPEDRSLEGWANIIMRPDKTPNVPPPRPYTPTPKAPPADEAALDAAFGPEGDDGSGGLAHITSVIRGNRQRPADPVESEALLMYAEGAAIARRAQQATGRREPFTFNVVGATGEDRAAQLPSKNGRPNFPKYRDGDYLALSRGIIKRVGDPVEVYPPIPERASVAWLKAERDTLRRQLADGTITHPGRVRIQEIREALAARGIADKE